MLQYGCRPYPVKKADPYFQQRDEYASYRSRRQHKPFIAEAEYGMKTYGHVLTDRAMLALAVMLRMNKNIAQRQ